MRATNSRAIRARIIAIALQTAVFADMDLYKSGVKRLDAPQRYPQPSAPTAER